MDMRNKYITDTTLRLMPSSTQSSSIISPHGTKRKLSDFKGKKIFQEDAFLALGFSHSSSSSDCSRKSSATICTLSSAKEAEEESAIDLGLNFDLHLGLESEVHGKKAEISTSKALNVLLPFDLNLSLSTGPCESCLTSAKADSTVLNRDTRSLFNEGSSSDLMAFGTTQIFYEGQDSYLPLQGNPNFPSSTVSLPSFPVSSSSHAGHRLFRNANAKICQFLGCGKGARGSSGFCIAHGGGRRCKKDGCQKGAEGRTVFCKAHGGGRRCEHLGCTKSAEGRTGYCIAHGGGRRCGKDGCIRAARGKSGLCIRHGGGKRCQKENCTRSAEGFSGLCISHGGGRRCQFPECTKGAQGSTLYCKAHGGGKRCTYLGCSKGAEGSTPFCKAHGGGKRCSHKGGCSKSVHGGTQFCVAHGGGKRCALPDCPRSARGRTDFCVRHGGGKRCKFEGCTKSAQGSTDYCKAHGGGKRCSWGHVGSLLGANDAPCERFARGKIGLCAAHSGVVQDVQVHGAEVLANMKMKEASVDDGGTSPASWAAGRVTFGDWRCFSERFTQATDLLHSRSANSLPEGRVHGGSLMVMLANTTVMSDRALSCRKAADPHEEKNFSLASASTL